MCVNHEVLAYAKIILPIQCYTEHNGIMSKLVHTVKNINAVRVSYQAYK